MIDFNENGYKLINGDCYQQLKLLEDNSIDLIYTDPPYKYRIFNEDKTVNENDNTRYGKAIIKYLTVVDDITQKDYDLERFCKECIRVMKEPNIYIWCNKAQIIDYMKFFVIENECNYQILVWNKLDALPTYANKYIDDCEYCLYFYKGKGKCFPKSYEDAKKVYIDKINRDYKVWKHPTIKPLDFVRSHISNSSRPGDIILDPFMGSGTTGLAVKQLGEDRKFIGIELEKEYFDIAGYRIEGYESIPNKDDKKEVLW